VGRTHSVASSPGNSRDGTGILTSPRTDAACAMRKFLAFRIPPTTTTPFPSRARATSSKPTAWCRGHEPDRHKTPTTTAETRTQVQTAVRTRWKARGIGRQVFAACEPAPSGSTRQREDSHPCCYTTGMPPFSVSTLQSPPWRFPQLASRPTHLAHTRTYPHSITWRCHASTQSLKGRTFGRDDDEVDLDREARGWRGGPKPRGVASSPGEYTTRLDDQREGEVPRGLGVPTTGMTSLVTRHHSRTMPDAHIHDNPTLLTSATTLPPLVNHAHSVHATTECQDLNTSANGRTHGGNQTSRTGDRDWRG
jgi:hypothetical protein